MDMDGTLLDNMPHHTRAWIELFGRFGISIEPPEFSRHTAGRKSEEVVRHYLGDRVPADRIAELTREKERLYRSIIAQNLVPLAGLAPFLEAARAAGVPMALASAACRENIDFILDGLALRPFYAAVVSGGELPRGKPDPGIFLEAARRLDVPPSRCIVFEDAVPGLEAAKRAGMKAVFLTTTHGPAETAGYPDILAIGADFTGFSLPSLLAAV